MVPQKSKKNHDSTKSNQSPNGNFSKQVIPGIDFGTTNSQGAFYFDDQRFIIADPSGYKSHYGKAFPSIIHITQSGRPIIGQMARSYLQREPENTVQQIKKYIGDSKKTWTLRGKNYKTSQLVALVIGHIAKAAQTMLNAHRVKKNLKGKEKIKKLVVTVPAKYTSDQREIIKQAVSLAGYETARLINEPTAAAIAYGISADKPGRLAVVDIGGGTFDVTILDCQQGLFQVVSSDGDLSLGGAHMDELILTHVIKQVELANDIKITNEDRIALSRLKLAVEKAKINISDTGKPYEISIPYLINKGKWAHASLTLTPAKLHDLIQPQLDRLKPPFDRTITAGAKKANVSFDEYLKSINHVLLVGGPTRMSLVRAALKKISGKPPLGTIDPMECVANGAAVVGQMAAGRKRDIVFVDVTPITLGLEVENDMMAVLIPKDTPIPVSKSQVFTNPVDGQTIIPIRIYQGERARASANSTLGYFELKGLSPKPARGHRIRVSFDIDQNSILKVTAKSELPEDKGLSEYKTIENANARTKQQIDKFIADAKKFKQQDKAFIEFSRKLQELENKYYVMREMLSNLKKKSAKSNEMPVSNEKLKKLEKKLQGCNSEIIDLKRKKSESIEQVNRIMQSLDDLQKEIQKVMTEQFKKQKSANAGDSNQSASGTNSNANEDVEIIDANDAVDASGKSTNGGNSGVTGKQAE